MSVSNQIICSMNTFGLERIEVVLSAIASCGFHNVEISCEQSRPLAIVPEKLFCFGFDPYPHYGFSIKDVRGIVEQNGLKILGLNAGCEMAHVKSVDLMRARARAADFLSVKWVVTGLGVNKGREETGIICDHLRLAAHEAAKYGVIICVKTDGYLTSGGLEALDLLKLVDSKNVKLDYDPSNILYYNDRVDLKEYLKIIIKHIGCVHLRESAGKEGATDFPPLGRGVINWRAMFETLNAAGYDGPFVLDLDNSYLWKPDPKQIPLTHSYWQTKQYDRDGTENNIRRVKESLEFLTGITRIQI